MFSCLKAFRWGITLFFSILLSIIIIIGIPLASLSMLLSDSANVKNWIKQGDNYSQIVDFMFSDKVELPEGFENIMTEKELKKTIKDVYSEKWIKGKIVASVDVVYSWLKGERNDLDFPIYLKEKQKELNEVFKNEARKYVSSLPECDEGQAVSPENFDPYSAECVPVGVDMNDINKEVEENVKQFMNGEDFPTFEMKTSEAVDKRARQVFSIINGMPKIVLIAILISSGILLFVVPGVKNKFLVCALVWVIAGTFILVGNPILQKKVDTKVNSLIDERVPEEGKEIGKVLEKPLQSAKEDVKKVANKYAFILDIFGGVMLVGAVVMRFKKEKYYVDRDRIEREV